MQPLIAKRTKAEPSHGDPAPSRWSYRFQRLMLTPAIVLMLRAGVPLCLTLGLATFYLSDQERRDQITTAVAEARNAIETRPEFMVNLMAVDGAGHEVAKTIRDIVPIEFPVTSFDLELEQIRQTIASLDPVKEVSVRIRPGGVLQVDVVEREPAVLWRTHAGLQVLDAGGVHVAPTARRDEWPDLPLIAGDGADRHVREALSLIRAASPLGARLRGVVRIGKRRWDVVLDRGQRVLLPEIGPVQALERVIALSQAQDVLARDLAAVDMRLVARPTIRMNTAAVEEWWRIQHLTEIGKTE
ncbi:MAG: cell division protein FtsQ/DivIB [Paracoccaceae bacterium]